MPKSVTNFLNGILTRKERMCVSTSEKNVDERTARGCTKRTLYKAELLTQR
jgi:hypothetical protein